MSAKSLMVLPGEKPREQHYSQQYKLYLDRCEERGEEAFFSKIAMDQNPFSPPSDSRDRWRLGWVLAFRWSILHITGGKNEQNKAPETC